MRLREEITHDLEGDRRIFAEEVLRNRLFLEVLLDLRDIALEIRNALTVRRD